MRSKRTALRVLAVSATAILLAAGCVAPVATYDGEHADDEVAVIEMGTLGRIQEIDSQPWDGHSFRVLPGEHHVKFFIQLRGERVDQFFKGQRTNIRCDARIDAQAGRTYRIVMLSVEVGDQKSKVSGGSEGRFEPRLAILDATDGSTAPGNGTCLM